VFQTPRSRRNVTQPCNLGPGPTPVPQRPPATHPESSTLLPSGTVDGSTVPLKYTKLLSSAREVRSRASVRLSWTTGNAKSPMSKHQEVFNRAMGEYLHPGTINVNVRQIREEFRINGDDIYEPEQDLLFERCRINGYFAYRIRHYHKPTGGGGHGDRWTLIASLKRPAVGCRAHWNSQITRTP
jgi:hypothetical protein